MNCRTCSEHWDFFGLQRDCRMRKAAQHTGSPKVHKQTPISIQGTTRCHTRLLELLLCPISPHLRSSAWAPRRQSGALEHQVPLPRAWTRWSRTWGWTSDTNTARTQGSSVLLKTRECGVCDLGKAPLHLFRAKQRQPSTSALVGDSQTTSRGWAAPGAHGKRRPHESFEEENCCAYLPLKVLLHPEPSHTLGFAWIE